MATTRTELLKRAPRTVLPRAGQRVLCAVSGGLDSMCLLFMLDAWCRERDRTVIAAHFNHQLRCGTADRDEEFVRGTCAKWDIPLTVGRGDVRGFAKREGLSIEEAARNLRYGFLRRAAEEAGCERVYTAHHADDNAETILLNLIRGTGITGLTGMDWEHGGTWRPLLGVTREELEAYAASWNVPHVEDETNADPGAASRNFLRLRVMPLLRELNPRAVEHICRTAGYLRTADESLEEDALNRLAHVKLREGRVSLPVDALFDAPPAVRPRMLLELFDRLGAGRKDVGAVHLEAVLALAGEGRHRTEGRISLPHGVTARHAGGRLILESRPQDLTEVRLLPDSPLRWGDYTLTLLDRPEGEGLALRCLKKERGTAWTIGPCPPGERLTLPGSRGARSVKRLCLDHKISLAERDRLPAVYVGNELAAVWRLGVDQAFAPKNREPFRFIKIEKHMEEDEADAQRNGE